MSGQTYISMSGSNCISTSGGILLLIACHMGTTAQGLRVINSIDLWVFMSNYYLVQRITRLLICHWLVLTDFEDARMTSKLYTIVLLHPHTVWCTHSYIFSQCISALVLVFKFVNTNQWLINNCQSLMILCTSWLTRPYFPCPTQKEKQ